MWCNILTLSSRASTSARSPRGSKEAKTPTCRCARGPRTSRQDSKGCWSQAHVRCCGRRYPRRVSAPEQDPVPAGASRHSGPGDSHECVWKVRRASGSQTGTGKKGNCIRGVRERIWRYQCEGGYIGDADGPGGETNSGYVPETMSCLLLSCFFIKGVGGWVYGFELPNRNYGVCEILTCMHVWYGLSFRPKNLKQQQTARNIQMPKGNTLHTSKWE